MGWWQEEACDAWLLTTRAHLAHLTRQLPRATRVAMEHDTNIGGARGGFPTTRRSAVRATRSEVAAERTQALEVLAGVYWKPVYKYLRLKWKESSEDARDLTQGFFALAIEKRFFETYDPARAKFRTYLRVCVDGFVANERKAARRLKRSPGSEILSLDFEAAEGEMARQAAPESLTHEEYFHHEWVRSLFSIAVERLRDECAARGKDAAFRVFELYDLDGGEVSPPTYQKLATQLALPVTQVTNFLAFTRREFRRILLDRLREVTGSEEEFRSEARMLLRGDPP